MNFKKTIVSLFAVGTLLVSGGGAVLGQSATNGTSGTVQITDTGTFDAQFCGTVQFDPVSINSLNPGGKTQGQLLICYTDTQAHRGQFRTTIQASAFTSSGGGTFGANNVKPKFMYNVAQGQWGSGIGNIGAMKGNANYSDGAGGYVNSNATAGLWVGGDLSSAQYVGYGWAGVGTGGERYKTVNGNNHDQRLSNGSVAAMDLELTVPEGQTGGTYTTTFALNVTPTAP